MPEFQTLQHSLGPVSPSYLLGSGNPPDFKFLDTTQVLTLQAGLSKGRSQICSVNFSTHVITKIKKAKHFKNEGLINNIKTAGV